MGYLETHIPNKPWIRRIIDKIKERKLYQYYSTTGFPARNSEKILIFMADGRMRHGGLADRLCGIVSAYNYSKKNGYIFKVHFISPYRLDKILVPNTCDWIINEEDISYNCRDARPVYVSYLWNYVDSELYFKDKIEKKQVKQVHLYTNARYFYTKEFPILFKELFRPSASLQAMIDENKKRIPERYVSLTFRFQQLLGDFKEDGFPTLKSEEEKKVLVDKCLKCLMKLRDEKSMPVLVTSDSVTFLHIAEQIENVYTIPGVIRHMEYTQGEADISVDMKSYVDFLMVANAEVVHLCSFAPLYRSGFPKAASYVYGKPYVELTEKYIFNNRDTQSL